MKKAAVQDLLSRWLKVLRKEPFSERIFSRLLLQLTIALIVGGCLTPLERFAEYKGGQPVISGQVSPVEETSHVFIGRTADRERLPEPVSGATVILLDDMGDQIPFIEEIAGKYVPENFLGVPGRTYRIRVHFPDGEVYESVPEKMPVSIGTDDVYYTIEPQQYTDQDGIVTERNFIRIFTSHTLPDQQDPPYIKWHVEEVYAIYPTDFPDPFGNVPPPCFVYQQVDPQNIVLFNGEEVKTQMIPDLEIISRLIDPSFKERHYFTTYQSYLTREAYEYWRKADVVANQVGSIFDAPPARIKGNIFNVNDQTQEVLGYFQAANQDFDRFYLLPDDLPFKLDLHCEYRPERTYFDYPSECLDCSRARNSSPNRPPWF